MYSFPYLLKKKKKLTQFQEKLCFCYTYNYTKALFILTQNAFHRKIFSTKSYFRKNIFLENIFWHLVCMENERQRKRTATSDNLRRWLDSFRRWSVASSRKLFYDNILQEPIQRTRGIPAQVCLLSYPQMLIFLFFFSY